MGFTSSRLIHRSWDLGDRLGAPSWRSRKRIWGNVEQDQYIAEDRIKRRICWSEVDDRFNFQFPVTMDVFKMC